MPDAGVDRDTLAMRAEKERAGLTIVEQLRMEIRTLAQMHHWLFTVHGAYSWTGLRRAPDQAPLY